MNSGRYIGTITAEQHAKSVVDKLGWRQTETVGHWRHYVHRGMMTFLPTKWVIGSINQKRRMDFMKSRR